MISKRSNIEPCSIYRTTMKTVTFRKKSAYKPLVPAVEQVSRILLCLGEGDRFKMRLTDICKQVGIHKSKGHRSHFSSHLTYSIKISEEVTDHYFQIHEVGVSHGI